MVQQEKLAVRPWGKQKVILPWHRTPSSEETTEIKEEKYLNLLYLSYSHLSSTVNISGLLRGLQIAVTNYMGDVAGKENQL